MPRGDLWRAPHLPFFLLASLWAGLVPLIWLFPETVCDPVAWHRQELVLGVAGAAMAGYLLTALPHWTGRAGVGRKVTQALVLAWLAGRVAAGPCLPDAPALVALGLLPIGLTVALVGQVMAAGAWHRLPIALAPLLLILIAARLRYAGDGLAAGLGLALLVALVGGRILPAFLHARTTAPMTPRKTAPPSARLADLVLGLALTAHLAGAAADLVGGLVLIAAAGQALRMLGWPMMPGLRAAQADLLALLVAWAWLPLGLAVLGAALIAPLPGLPGPLPLSTALHALTMGMMGGMILAIMARAWAMRGPGVLYLGPLPIAGLALVHLATVLRLGWTDPVLPALCWSAGWALAGIMALAAPFRALPHPILSARRDPGSHGPGLPGETMPCPSAESATSLTSGRHRPILRFNRRST